MDSAAVRADEAESRFGAAGQELFLRTASLYFDVLRADDALDFATAAESALVEQVNFAEATLARGLGTRPDLLVAMSRLESARADKVAATTAQFAAQEFLPWPVVKHRNGLPAWMRRWSYVRQHQTTSASGLNKRWSTTRQYVRFNFVASAHWLTSTAPCLQCPGARFSHRLHLLAQ